MYKSTRKILINETVFDDPSYLISGSWQFSVGEIIDAWSRKPEINLYT